MHKGYIYKITCLTNQKIYIGQTTKTIEERFKEHCKDSKIFDYPLYRGMRKYGIDSFIIELIEECDVSLLNDRECYWIKVYDSVAWHNKGYNGTWGGDGCYRKDIDPELIKYYINLKYDIMEISKFLNCSHNTIRRIAHNNNITIPLHPHQSKTVIMMDLFQQKIQEFYSIRDAAIWLIDNNFTTSTSIAGIQSNISKCCKGNRPTAYQHKWEYK